MVIFVTPTFYGTVLEASVQPAAVILRKFSDGGYLDVQEVGTCPMRGRTSLGRQGSWVPGFRSSRSRLLSPPQQPREGVV